MDFPLEIFRLRLNSHNFTILTSTFPTAYCPFESAIALTKGQYEIFNVVRMPLVVLRRAAANANVGLRFCESPLL
ncbi:MAG: hypothetical protein AAFR62_13535 [Cyanobacteria bacterium J06629_2]